MERIWTLILILILTIELFSQNAVKKKQEELKRLREEINLYEMKIKEARQKEKLTLDIIDDYEKRENLLRKLIAELKKQASENEREIKKLQDEISRSEQDIKNLKEKYASYIRSTYKRGRTHDLELILSARSLNQMLIRAVYLKKFSEFGKSVIDTILSKQENLKRQKLELEIALSRQKELIAQKEEEEKNLILGIKEKRELLEKIRKDKQNLQAQVERRKKAIKEIESAIAKLIEEEKEKRRKEEIERRKKVEIPKIEGAFAKLKGKLPWPVDNGKIVARYGEQVHPVLKTVTLNYGIDILVESESKVRAVADGIVSKIFWLPSFENLIIITHDGGYRTVYANLSDIFVSEGEKVNAGQVIGKSGESIEGSIVHFEIWHERRQQNPEIWLSKK